MALVHSNTGGRNYDETEPGIARNAVHHSIAYPSSVTVTVVPRATSTERQR